MPRPAARQGILFISLATILFIGAAGARSFAQTLADTNQAQESAPELKDKYPDEGVDGIGHLTIRYSYLERIAGNNMSRHEASKTVKIVFFDRPQGREIAKIEKGVLSKGDQIINRDFSAPLLTYYSQPSFTVLAKRSGGWYRIRYMVGKGSDGTGWVQVKTRKQDPFAYLSWQEYFLDTDNILADFMNNKGNNLYDRPSISGKRLKDIGGSIQIQEFRGDWMRVKFQDKVFNCAQEPAPRNAKVRTGWVKWRNQGRLLIGAPPKGC
jgi:hypothetical protein